MKEPHYYLPLTEYEQSVILQSLYDKKNALLRAGRTTDALDELIIKVANARVKHIKVIERGGYADAR